MKDERRRVRLRYSRAFMWGLLVSALSLLSNYAGDGGKDFRQWLNYGTTAEIVTYFGTMILMWPILFALIALLINRFRKSYS